MSKRVRVMRQQNFPSSQERQIFSPYHGPMQPAKSDATLRMGLEIALIVTTLLICVVAFLR